MEKRNNKQVSEPATKVDLRAMNIEITVTGLATQETVRAVMETAAKTKEGVTALKGLMKEIMAMSQAVISAILHQAQHLGGR
jgi:hypothetical protein